MFDEAHSFGDVLLEPQKSDISSRSEIDLSVQLGGKKYNLPIMSSPMDTVTESTMSAVMSEIGGLGIVHRYCSIQEQCAMISVGSKAAAIGVSEDMMPRARALYEAGARVFCIDVAHGHHPLVEKALKSLRDEFGNQVTLIAGNVATREGYEDLSSWGADAVRVGIGGGSICSTRIQTGHGIPTFQSILYCASGEGEAKIIADGGLRTAGDIVKAYAAGADFVMLGSMLAGTDEAPGDTFQGKSGKKYKVYRGMASKEAQFDWRGEARSLEGISTTIPYKGSVVNILKDLEQNIRSGLSYSGARNFEEFRRVARFIKQSSSGQSESGTHILNVSK